MYIHTYICIYLYKLVITFWQRKSLLNGSRIDNMPSLIIAALFNAFVRPFNAISGAYARSRSAWPSVGFPINTHARADDVVGRWCVRPRGPALQAASGSRRIVGFPRPCLHCPVVLLRDAHSHHPRRLVLVPVGATHKAGVSHISRLIVSICRSSPLDDSCHSGKRERERG